MVEDDPRLSRRVKKVVNNPQNDLVLSTVSILEIPLKAERRQISPDIPGELLPAVVQEQLKLLDIAVLPVAQEHIFGIVKLPMLHRDPFDRLLLAQAHAEKIPFVSADAQVRTYPVAVIW